MKRKTNPGWDPLKCSPKIWKKLTNEQKAVWLTVNACVLFDLKSCEKVRRLAANVIAHNAACYAAWSVDRPKKKKT